MSTINPGRVVACPACGLSGGNRTLKACSLDCLRLSATTFMDTTKADSISGAAHMHVTCNYCDFQWLETVHDEQRMKELW